MSSSVEWVASCRPSRKRLFHVPKPTNRGHMVCGLYLFGGQMTRNRTPETKEKCPLCETHESRQTA